MGWRCWKIRRFARQKRLLQNAVTTTTAWPLPCTKLSTKEWKSSKIDTFLSTLTVADWATLDKLCDAFLSANRNVTSSKKRNQYHEHVQPHCIQIIWSATATLLRTIEGISGQEASVKGISWHLFTPRWNHQTAKWIGTITATSPLARQDQCHEKWTSWSQTGEKALDSRLESRQPDTITEHESCMVMMIFSAYCRGPTTRKV